jgi:UDP:flavonoid glycosyltransferase YjiC (YdhE family)
VLAAKNTGKLIIFASQGTFMIDYTELLIPTLKALAGRDDCMVIGALGIRGAKLEGVEITINAKIVDFLLYDAVLKYADVFVSNAGYGGLMHSVMNGVLMVLAGTGREFSASLSHARQFITRACIFQQVQSTQLL